MTNATTSHIQINKNYHFNYSCDDKKALPSKVFQRCRYLGIKNAEIIFVSLFDPSEVSNNLFGNH